MTLPDMIGLILQDAFWSALAALGFAILFNVPPRALPYCLAVGALGHAVRTFMTAQFGMSVEFATLFGATTVGLAAEVCAQRLKMPMVVFAIVGAIPMVPGAFAFRAMLGLLSIPSATLTEANTALIQATVNGIKTGLILGALALGILAPGLMLRREKPVV